MSQRTKGVPDTKLNSRTKPPERLWEEWEVDEMIREASRKRFTAYCFGAVSTFLVTCWYLGLLVPLLQGLLRLMSAS